MFLHDSSGRPLPVFRIKFLRLQFLHKKISITNRVLLILESRYLYQFILSILLAIEIRVDHFSFLLSFHLPNVVHQVDLCNYINCKCNTVLSDHNTTLNNWEKSEACPLFLSGNSLSTYSSPSTYSTRLAFLTWHLKDSSIWSPAHHSHCD